MNTNLMTRLIVCGDSFNSLGNIKYPGTHWSEIVARELNLELINLAMPGCSSRAICYQLMYALRQPDAIVISGNAASVNRIEITSTPDDYGRDISKFVYPYRTDHPLTKYDAVTSEPHVRSIPIMSLKDKEIQDVFLSKMCMDIFSDIDKWSILATLRILKNKQVPFLFFETNTLTGPQIQLDEYLDFIDLDDLILGKDLNPFLNVYNHAEMTLEEIEELDPGYHTHPDEQKRIAEYMLSRLASQFKIIKNGRHAGWGVI